jgi:hypothetical protein
MVFVVRAISQKSGEGTFLVDKATRLEAFETAVGLEAKGVSEITIMGEDGHIFTPSEFALTLAEDS